MKAAIIKPKALWLILPPIVLSLLDFSLTLYGQSESYWSGNYSSVNEGSPTFSYLLSVHPFVFVGVALFWIISLSIVVLLLPELLALIFSMTIVIGHMAGAASWVLYVFHLYFMANIIFILTASLVVVSFKRGQRSDGRAAFYWQQTKLPDFVRWLIIVFLLVFPAWWFIIPR